LGGGGVYYEVVKLNYIYAAQGLVLNDNFFRRS